MAFLKKYPTFSLSDEDIKSQISDHLKDISNYDTTENLKRIFSIIDLTSLNSFDTPNNIDCFINQLNNFSRLYPKYHNIAAICVYPPFIPQIKTKLQPQTNIKIASVAANFPSSQTYLEVKMLECELLIKDGADELDIVMPLRLFLDKNYNKVLEEIKTIKGICGSKNLKVILETGVLKQSTQIYEASLLAMEGGADFIKTSTGKLDPAATLEAVYVICQAILEFNKAHNRKIGIKAAGGISNSEEALKYYVLVQKMLGIEYMSKDLFRIGASKLANNILSKIEGVNVSYFGERVFKNENLEKDNNHKGIEKKSLELDTVTKKIKKNTRIEKLFEKKLEKPKRKAKNIRKKVKSEKKK